MASPPFSINEALPGDSDIVSQHPTNARAFRDQVESWLLINHNVQGRHDEVDLDFQADPAGTASVSRIWASSTGNAAGKLKMRRGTGNVEYVGVFPSAIVFGARTTEPEGWLFCAGQNVSRSTYADLFDAIGTTYGVGDGSTTFGIPDIKGRVIAGQDDMNGSSANRLTGLSGGVDGDVLGATGGLETHTLTLAESAAHNHGGTTSAETANLVLSYGTVGVTGGGGSAVSNIDAVAGAGTNETFPDHFHNITSGGGDAPHNNVQPTIILNAFIKT